jgi:hypothetical protein
MSKKKRKEYSKSASHCTKNPIYVFSEMKLRGLVPNTYIKLQRFLNLRYWSTGGGT